MQPQFLAAARRQPVLVKARQPGAAKTQRVLLSIIAVIPDEVARTRLPVKQPVEGFHPVTINQNHAVIIGSVFSNRKASIAAQSALFFPALKDGFFGAPDEKCFKNGRRRNSIDGNAREPS